MAEQTALRNNALPYPVYGAPYGITFPILDADGDLATGAAGLDSEVSKNGDAFADCTNEATEIGSTGMYYLLLTATEMTADVVTVIVQTSTSGAKTTPIVLYPRKLVTLLSGTSAGGAAGYITLASGAVEFDDQYNGCLCVATIDSNIEARILQACTSSNDQCTVTPSWNVTPDADDTYIIYLPEGMQVPTVDIKAINAALTDGTPAVASRPKLHLQQLDLECAIDDEGAFQATNTHAAGVGALYSGNYVDIILANSGSIYDNPNTQNVSVNLASISGDATAANNLESQYDGTGLTGDTYPSRQDQVGNISAGASGLSINAGGATITTGSETNDHTDTYSSGTIHIVEDAVGTTDFYYEFDVSEYTGVATEFLWNGYVQSNGDSVEIQYYDWATTSYMTLETIAGANGTTITDKSWDVPVGATGTGANLGLIRMRFSSATTTAIGTDRVRCVFNQSVSGITNGSTVTLGEATINKNLVGNNWNLALGGQEITGTYISGATVSGISSGSGGTTFEDCLFGASTIPPGTYVRCGFGDSDGLITFASAGDYIFIDCFSIVEGSGTPDFTASGLGGSVGINVRGWNGGCNWTLDSDCTISHEVHQGGGQTFTTGGANVELRGLYRDATFVLSGGGTVQCIGMTGGYTISGTATTTVKLYGVASFPLADTSSGTTVIDETVSRTNMIGGDYSLNTDSNGNVTVFGATATYFQDWFTVDSTQVSGDEVSGSAMLEQAKIVWDRILTGATHNIATSAGRRLRDIASHVVHTGTATAGSANTITLDGAASASDGSYDPSQIIIVGGTGSGQVRGIIEYFGSGGGNGNAAKTAIIDRDWKTTPDATSEFTIVATDGRLSTNEGQIRAATHTVLKLNTLAPGVGGADLTGQTIQLLSGTGQDQVRLIQSYNGTDQEATVEALEVTPDATTGYQIIPVGSSTIDAILDDYQSVTDLKEFVDDCYQPTANVVLTGKHTEWFMEMPANGGSDSNNGYSKNDPLATLKYALSVMSAGDTLHIGTGEFGGHGLSGAAVDKGGGKVGFPVVAHDFVADESVVITGTTNYDGKHTVDADTTANEVVITDTFVNETFGAQQLKYTQSINNGEDAVDRSDLGANMVGIPVTEHGFSVGDFIRIENTVNYDNRYILQDGTTTDQVVIYNATGFESETFGADDIISKQSTVDLGDNRVGIPIGAHSFSANDSFVLSGTTHYDRVWPIESVTTNQVVIVAEYLQENFEDTDYAKEAIVRSTTSVTLTDGIKLKGNSSTSTRLYCSDTGFISSTFLTASSASGVQITDLAAINVYKVGRVASIRSRVNNWLVEDCYLEGGYDGFRADDLNTSLFNRCQFVSAFDATICGGVGTVYKDCTMLTTGVEGSDLTPAGAFRTSNLASIIPYVTLIRCDLRAWRVTAEDFLMLGVEADTEATVRLIDCSVDVRSTNSGDTGAIHGVRSEEESNIAIIRGRIATSNDGSGAEYSLIQEDTSTFLIDIAASDYDSTKTSGTITYPIPTYGDDNWVTATSVEVSDKTGFKLASDGLDLVTAWATNITGSLSGSVGSVAGNVDGSVIGSVESVTSGVSLTVSERNSTADAILNRAAENIEDTADRHSLGAVILIATNSSISGTTLTSKKPSDDSAFQAYTVTVDASADPITGVS